VTKHTLTLRKKYADDDWEWAIWSHRIKTRMLYNVMLTRSSAVAVTADRTAYIWYSSRSLSGITVVACVFTYLQFQTEGCFWCLSASDHCVSCQLLCWVLIFAVLCGKTIHPTTKSVWNALLGTRWYNFQPHAPTLSARMHSTAQRQMTVSCQMPIRLHGGTIG